MSKNGKEIITKNVNFDTLDEVRFDPKGNKVYQQYMYDNIEIGAKPVAVVKCYDRKQLEMCASKLCEEYSWKRFNVQVLYETYWNELYMNPFAVRIDTGELIS